MPRGFLVIVSFLAVGVLAAPHGFAAESWPGWRGPQRDGLSPDEGLRTAWEGAPPLLWSASNLGLGFSSVAIADERLFTMGDRDGSAFVLALAAGNGRELWATAVGETYRSGRSRDPGPRCTPAYDEGRVYAMTPAGKLVCLQADSGDLIWSRDLKGDFGGRMMSGWGYSESPLVDGDQLLCTPGSEEAMIVALDKRTGEEIWRTEMPESRGGKRGAGYSSLVVSHGAGVKQYIQLVGRGLIGVAAGDGRLLWEYPRVANGTANVPTPLVKDDLVFCSSGYGTGAALLELIPSGDGVRAQEVYFLNASQLQNHHGGMLLVGDYVYCGRGHNDGRPTCIELATGEHMWPERSRAPGSGSAAVTYADGHIYFRYQNGVMALVPADPSQYEVAGQFEIPGVDKPSWSHPVVFDGRLYLREQDSLYVYDLRR